MKRRVVFLTVLALGAAGCAVRLGGSGPLERDTLALRVPASMTSEQLGARLQQGGYEFAMLNAPFDSAWLAAAAQRAGLQMTRPGRITGSSYVFFGPKPVGDTTHVINVPSGGRIRLHDALYQIDKSHSVDLILAHFDSITNLRQAVQELLRYVGSDVSGTAALLLGVDATTPQLGDSVSVIIRALYSDTRECAGDNARGTQPTIRLFYGPTTRIRCERAEILSEAGAPVSAQFVLP